MNDSDRPAGGSSGPAGIAKTPLNPSGHAFARIVVGDIEIFQLFEGSASRPMGPEFFSNVTLSEVERVLNGSGFAPDRIPNAYTVTVARIGGKLIMFDAGLGEGGRHWPVD